MTLPPGAGRAAFCECTSMVPIYAQIWEIELWISTHEKPGS
jgi:hypothetical protein